MTGTRCTPTATVRRIQHRARTTSCSSPTASDQGDDILTGGSTKDVNDISSWLWKQNSTTSVQDKDDIENAFAAAYTSTSGHSIGVFGLDRYSISGDATAGFWFFKNQIAKTGNGSGNGTGFSGVHAEGDVLVVIDFVNGGSQGTATVYKWHNGALVSTARPATSATTAPAGRVRHLQPRLRQLPMAVHSQVGDGQRLPS